jgi:hypothetical protein
LNQNVAPPASIGFLSSKPIQISGASMPSASLFSKRLYTTGVFVLFTVMVIDLMCNALADNTDIRIYFVSFFSAQLVAQVCPLSSPMGSLIQAPH